ncbi:MAG TPA: response regulator [Terracidiphilus sp.]|nr:response regulator [Terracidiphilus sp.]
MGYELTILLVDDDPLQAFVRKSILEKRFSDVRRVSGAAEALGLVEQPHFADNLGLVVSGHHLAGIGGPAFVAELHTRMPYLPVLVLGDSDEVKADYCVEGVLFLPRPFVAEEILTAAGQMLAQSAQKTA